jgi:hypothetical protein
MPNGRRDEGAPLPAANPRIESVDQFIVQTYVQTDGHRLAHRRGFAASIGGSARRHRAGDESRFGSRSSISAHRWLSASSALSGVEIARVEGDGWVNWSGLATLLANTENAFVPRVDGVLSRTLPG